MKIFKYRAILLAIMLCIGIVSIVWGIDKALQPRELEVCFEIYNDETVDLDIRQHCINVMEEWRVKRRAEELEDKQDYIKNFQRYKFGQ